MNCPGHFIQMGIRLLVTCQGVWVSWQFVLKMKSDTVNITLSHNVYIVVRNIIKYCWIVYLLDVGVYYAVTVNVYVWKNNALEWVL